MRTKIVRLEHQEKQTLGNLIIYDSVFEVFKCNTLELPWKNNQVRISCIPAGTYKLVKHTSPKFGKCFHVLDVPGRSEILIHKGNFYTDILGCILPGQSFTDINNDGWLDVTYSQKTVERMLNILPDSSYLDIYGDPELLIV